MWKVLLSVLLMASWLFGYDFKVTVKWNEMAMTGEAEAMLQYYHEGKVETIHGNLNKASKDGNVQVNRTLSGGSREFIINHAQGNLFNIWVVNDLMDEEFATEDDMYMLSDAQVQVWVEDRVNHTTYQIQLPPKTAGLVFRAGAIVDGHFYKFFQVFKKKRLYDVTLIDAVTGKPLPGAGVVIKNQRTGETVAMGQTDEKGNFMYPVEYGAYDVLFTKQGYLEAKHEFEMGIDELPVSMNFALSPVIKKYRIVLTWGAFPPDLDAHLAGPNPDGGRFHIWWRNKVLIAGKNFLDRDDQSSYGPETITIYKPARGEYVYAVHNYSGRNHYGSLDLSFSGAHVDVYADGRLQASFDVPRGQKGNVWEVFKLSPAMQIIPLNRMYDETNSARVIR